MQEDIKQVKSGVERLKAAAHFDYISNWLSPPDPSTNYNNALERRHSGSGKWFLAHTAYSRWKSESNSFLWLYGIPGCGKTVLSSTIVEDLRRNRTSQSLLYFYFDFNDTSKQNLDMMLRSFISQLYNKCENVRSCLDTLYSSCSQGISQPSLESLRRAFQDMLHKAEDVWIVIDALDECQTRRGHSGGGVLSWIQSLQDSQKKLHLLLTSRPEQDINASIRGWARDQDILSIQGDLVRGDIDAYIRARVKDNGEFRRWHTRPDIQAEIEAALIEKADGMCVALYLGTSMILMQL